MLRATVVSPKQAENYYRQENYYSKKESKQNSQWYGKGADKLGLKGQIESEDFANLLHGELPDGEKFRKRPPTHAEYKERAGIDLTFSAPKSVSLAVLVNNDRRLEAAHREAVKTALSVVEERYASTRIRQDGERKAIVTGNLIIGQFHHDSSREKDPQLHTHAVIINGTQTESGQWYSLRNDDILKNQKLLSGIYQNELANQAQKLGYGIEQRDSGHFELQGYSKEHLEHFSKRRKQIVAAVGAEASAQAREFAALKTRKPKGKEIPREELQKYWQAEAKILGIEQPQLKPMSQKKDEGNSTVNQATNEAIAHAAEKQVNFRREEIEKFVLSQTGKYSWKELQKSIEQNQNLLQATNNEYTTLSALNRELDTIRIINQGKGTSSSLSTPEKVLEQLKEQNLTPGQSDAVLTASTTMDSIMAWQGKAGAGKTYALNQYRQIAQQQGYTVKGYAPSATAAKVLGEEVGIESNTVARKLVTPTQKQEKKPGQIWIVDEAGLLSAKDTHTLLQKAEQEKARILLVGDTRQLSAVEAGNPFKSLQKAGMTTTYLNQSLRQKTADLKLAVEQISEGQISQGIKILDKNGRI